MSDQFFDDEDDLAREQEQAAKQPARPAAAQGSGKKPELDAAEMKAAAARHGCKPPSFGMAVGIAAVALLLGICIGYFFAMNVVSRTGSVAIDGTSTMGTASTSTTSTSATTSGSSDAATASDSSDEEASTALPEGHPDLSQFYNADGSLDEEAIAEWKAARAAETSSSDDADSTEDVADGTQATSSSSDAPADASSDADTKSETK